MTGWTNTIGSGWITGAPLVVKTEEVHLMLLVKLPLLGTKVGDLAVCWNDGEWQVAHVPTLAWFRKAVPPGRYQKETLVSWCHKVQQELRDDWEALAKLTPETYEDDGTDEYEPILAIKDRIREHCLAVPVI